MEPNFSIKKDLADFLMDKGIKLAHEKFEELYAEINKTLNYEPKVGVLGKTGVGKSSLCNALFGKNTAEVNDVEGCTRNPQEVFLPFAGEKGIKLIDCPGIGENVVRNKEYIDLYRGLIPELDLILWVIKADDRALSIEEEFYKNIVKPTMKVGLPFIVAVNQVDKMEPYREWDIARSMPGPKQATNIEQKVKNVQNLFNLIDRKVFAVSATEKYNLVKLVDEIVRLLPEEKRYGFVNNLISDVISDESKRLAQEALNKRIVLGLLAVGVAVGIGALIKLGPEPIVANLEAAGVAVGKAVKSNAGVAVEKVVKSKIG
jgi:small GTP-binding protein